MTWACTHPALPLPAAGGALWHLAYDQEGRSNRQARGLDRLIGMATRVNLRWVPVARTGELRFYARPQGERLEFMA